MYGASDLRINAHMLIERRNRCPLETMPAAESTELLVAVENGAQQQRLLGLGDPAVSLARVKKRMTTQILKAQANELAAVFHPVNLPNRKLLPRAEKFEDCFSVLPDVVICQLRNGTTHARCSVGPQPLSWIARKYEAPIPVMPRLILELAFRAKTMCPEMEFHLVLKPAWTELPQDDPVLLGRVPEVDEYFEIGFWEGDAELLESLST